MSTEELIPSDAPSGETKAEPHPAGPSRRALRVMGIVRWSLLALVTLLAGTTVWTFWGPGKEEHAEHEEALYYCPMHPQIRSPEPGECPICHMNLEHIPKERLASESKAPEPQSKKTGGKDLLAGVTTVTLSKDKQQSVGLLTTEVKSDVLGSQLRVPGVISAPESGLSQVRVRAAGFVEQVSVRQTGVRVSQGQPLAFIYSPEIYRAQEEFIAATKWAALPSAGESQGTAGTDLAKAARRGLELLGLSSNDIDKIEKTGQPIRAIAVRAPAPGYVTRFNALLGARADPEMVLYEIADLSNVWVVASVQERDLASMQIGTVAKVSLSGISGEPLEGKVDLIEPVLDESTRTNRVRILVKNDQNKLRPGQFGEVEFELPASAGLFVPRDAVIHTGDLEYVYVAIDGDQFEPRRVTTGVAREGRTQVLSGLREGERVVTRGSFMLDSESRLQASLSGTPAPSTSKSSSADMGPSCEVEFDAAKAPDKYRQCLACEKQHASMGRMVSDCKNAISRPWR